MVGEKFAFQAWENTARLVTVGTTVSTVSLGAGITGLPATAARIAVLPYQIPVAVTTTIVPSLVYASFGTTTTAAVGTAQFVFLQGQPPEVVRTGGSNLLQLIATATSTVHVVVGEGL